MEHIGVDEIAMVCHEANRAYCSAMGDNSQPSWSDAPDWQKKSAIDGVKFHIYELIEGNEPKPEASHQNWLKLKLADGWVYGPIKDEKAKTHPCCVPYHSLPPEQRRKDYIFIAIVKAFYQTATLSD